MTKGTDMKSKSRVRIAVATALLALGLPAAQAQSNTGGAAGALFFGKVGPSMEESDKQKTVEAVKSGKKSTWKNEKTGNEYTVETKRTFDNTSQTCRDYVIAATVAGKAQSSKGTACKQANGVWNMAR